jgi:hypothetical protein
MAILKGEEARQWLAQNPNKAYTNLTTNQQVAREPGFLERLGLSISKPFRSALGVGQEFGNTIRDLSNVSRGDWSGFDSSTGMGARPDKYALMSEEETEALQRDPVRSGLKSAAGVLSYAMPVGPAAGASSALGRIGTAGLKATLPGAMSSFALSEEGEELGDTLRGGALGFGTGAVLQGVGEVGRAIKAKPQGKLVDVSEVDEIAALPKKVKKGLVDQTRSAGFWDDSVGESKSIQNFLKNRGLAGKTPAETLENMTQEFYRAQGLKEVGLEEIGGLSKDYIEQIKGQLDEAVNYSGLGATETNAIKRMKSVLDRAPQDAKALDKIAQQWYDIALTKAGDLKASQSGLYKYGAKAIRDALKAANQGGSYTQGMSALSQILGLADEGLVSKTAVEAAKKGIDVPLFASAGFKGADVEVPGISNVVNRTRANIGLARETGRGITGNVIGGAARAMTPVANMEQRLAPALPALLGQGQPDQGMEQPGMQPDIYGQMAPQGPQIDEMALIDAVLSGAISTSEADWLMEMLGGGEGQQQMPKTDSGRKAMVARDLAVKAINLLEQDPSAAGKLQGIENIFYDVTGQANTATQYQTLLEGLRSQVFNALGGTSLTPTEKKQYEKFLPKISNSPEQAQQNLATLIPMMESLMGAEVPSPEQDQSALYQMLGL